MVLTAYVEELTRALSAASVKHQLAALRMLFEWLVIDRILPFNQMSSVHGPRHVVKDRKPRSSPPRRRRPSSTASTSRPWWASATAPSSATSSIQLCARERRGLASRRRLLHPGATVVLWLHEKGGRYNVVPAHHTAQEYLGAYLKAARIAGHESTRTTHLYNCLREEISLDEIERIHI